MNYLIRKFFTIFKIEKFLLLLSQDIVLLVSKMQIFNY